MEVKININNMLMCKNNMLMCKNNMLMCKIPDFFMERAAKT